MYKIFADNVSKRFPSRDKKVYGETSVIEDVTLGVEDGEFVSIIGPSGCGKSTLLKIISGLELPSAGSITISEQAREANEAAIRAIHAQPIMVWQEFGLLEWRTVRRNVELGLEFRNISSVDRKNLVDEVLDLVGLSNFANLYPRQVSGGMRQRVALARALVLNPDVLLMDEPFGALDHLMRVTLQDELGRICEMRKMTVAFVTHSIEEAVILSDRVVVLGHGHIVKEIKIDLPRPREQAMRTSPLFAEYCSELYSLLFHRNDSFARDQVAIDV